MLLNSFALILIDFFNRLRRYVNLSLTYLEALSAQNHDVITQFYCINSQKVSGLNDLSNHWRRARWLTRM